MRGLIALLKLLPYSLRKAILVALFDGIGYGIGIRKEVARKQLQAVFPDWSQDQIHACMKSMYRHMALNIAEIYLMNDHDLNSRSRIVGDEYVREALALGKGVILATAHFGNWEAARILPLRDMPLSVITKKQRNTLFDDYTNAIRERCGVHVLDMRRGLKDVISELGQNRIIAILADQNAGTSGIMLDFLGFPASHWKGVAKLSLRYKIPILPGFVIREKDDTLTFEFSELIYKPDLDDHEENYPAILNEINRITETYIRRYPEQWFWVHKRWKHGHDMFSDNH